MKVVIENIIAGCKIRGDLDLENISSLLDGSRYSPEVFDGISYNSETPSYKSFILKDGNIKFHGLTSEEGAKEAITDLLSKPPLRDSWIEEQLKVMEIVASVTLDGPVDPKTIFDTFNDEGIVYDPEELPGFTLTVGKTGIEVLIFPEGKIVSKGATDLLDAVSSLQMVYAKLNDKKE